LAVGRAGVVDEARLVAPDRRVDHHVVADGEEEGVVLLHRVVVVAGVRLVAGDALPDVLDDPRALAGLAEGQDPEPPHGRGADLEARVLHGARHMKGPTQGPVPQVATTMPVLKNWTSCWMLEGWTRSWSWGSPQRGGAPTGQRSPGAVLVSGAGLRPKLH